MINNKSHTKEWLEEKKKQFPKRDPGLIEKVIKALTLVEQLKLSGLEFTFKGGTSLILLLPEQKRFSIDIDIVITSGINEIQKYLNKIISFGVFKSFEEDKRTNRHNIPKRHFKLFYEPNVITNAPASILLDLLEEKNHYSLCSDFPINSPFVSYEAPATLVSIPTIDSILGDKLTAFAPTTTGILYGTDKSLEIAKQLFDVGHLFDGCNEISNTKATFEKIAKIELDYRNMGSLSYENVLDDIFTTSNIITNRGKIDLEKYTELTDGIKKLNAYIISGKFLHEDAIICASKAAYLSELLRVNNATLNKFHPKIDMDQMKIEAPIHLGFNKLKKYLPEAFYYWSTALKLQNIRKT